MATAVRDRTLGPVRQAKSALHDLEEDFRVINALLADMSTRVETYEDVHYPEKVHIPDQWMAPWTRQMTPYNQMTTEMCEKRKRLAAKAKQQEETERKIEKEKEEQKEKEKKEREKWEREKDNKEKQQKKQQEEQHKKIIEVDIQAVVLEYISLSTNLCNCHIHFVATATPA